MDFSKLKLELYDFIGVMLPGLLAISEGWIALRGWHVFVLVTNGISATALTFLIVLAFGIGNIVQELGDVCLKALKGKRFFRRARDRFWVTEEAQLVRDIFHHRRPDRKWRRGISRPYSEGPRGRKNCVPFTGSWRRRRSCWRSALRSTKSISEVSITRRSEAA